MLAKLRAQLRAKGICKSPKKNSALSVSIQLIIHSQVLMSVPVPVCDVGVWVGCGGDLQFCHGRRRRRLEKAR